MGQHAISVLVWFQGRECLQRRLRFGHLFVCVQCSVHWIPLVIPSRTLFPETHNLTPGKGVVRVSTWDKSLWPRLWPSVTPTLGVVRSTPSLGPSPRPSVLPDPPPLNRIDPCRSPAAPTSPYLLLPSTNLYSGLSGDIWLAPQRGVLSI